MIKTKKKKIEGFLYLLPFLCFYLVFTFGMLILTAVLSMTDYKILGEAHFVGLKNYLRLFSDSIFWRALGNTTLFVVVSTPVLIGVPFLLALLIEYPGLPIRGFFRTTFFAPQVMAVSMVAYIFLYMFQPYTGLVNNVLRELHVLSGTGEIYWLMNPALVWVVIVVETLWWAGGFNMILYIAGMQEIPEDYYECAELDGITYWQKVRYITLPLLSRVHITVLFLQLVASFKVFGQVFLLTGGDPGGATRTYIQYLYEQGFRVFEIGRASAASIFLMGIILIVSGIQYTVTSRAANKIVG